MRKEIKGFLKDTYVRGQEAQRMGVDLDIEKYYDTVADEIKDTFMSWLRHNVSLGAAWRLEEQWTKEVK